VLRYFTRLFLGNLKGSRPSFWKGSGCKSVPFYGLSLARHADQLAEWRRLLARISDPVAEVMVHPGMIYPGDDLMGDDFQGNRQGELDVLLSPEWRVLLQEMHVETTTFKDYLRKIPLTLCA
jgi:predicted glycoside hydrolase/deacetylase ChbG (UPF0249 family)